ncbi:MAG: phospholipid carrier-dependent glycosyltransferase, partial [bacterium]|nr:phospholipid carrier-dependent glycosyltransferase [bacterium]
MLARNLKRKFLPEVVFFILIFGLFLFRLTYFNFLVFDENYYVLSAIDIFLGHDDSNFEHPQLAKYLISLPFAYLGVWSFSWRLMPMMVGFLGVILIYIFGLKLGLSRIQGMIASLMLVGSGSWFVLSRLAMLDIFVSFFVLCAGFSLYIYLRENKFSRNFSEYSLSRYLWLYLLFTGFAGSCKLSGFFTLSFVVFYVIFYLESKLKEKIICLSMILFVPLVLYVLVNTAILGGDVGKFYSRTIKAFTYHNTLMLPGNYEEYQLAKRENLNLDDTQTPESKGRLSSGYKGFFQFIFQNHILYFISDYKVYALEGFALSNNQFVASGLLGSFLITMLSAIGKMIRVKQGVKVLNSFPTVEKPELLFLLGISLSLVLPWIFIPRVQYAFYYVPAFPFIILWVCIFIFNYVNGRIRLGLLICYFLYSAY